MHCGAQGEHCVRWPTLGAAGRIGRYTNSCAEQGGDDAVNGLSIAGGLLRTPVDSFIRKSLKFPENALGPSPILSYRYSGAIQWAAEFDKGRQRHLVQPNFPSLHTIGVLTKFIPQFPLHGIHWIP